jgi:hypothetical protein
MQSPRASTLSPPALAFPASPTLAAAQQFTALADIAALLRSDNDAVVGSGVRHIFEDRPMPGLTCALGPGSTGGDAARLIGSTMISLPVAFTTLVGALTRERPRMDVIPGTQGDTDLNADELAVVGGTPKGSTWGRAALMRAGTTTAAHTAIKLIRDLVPAGPMERIEAGTPVGEALDGWDMARALPSVAVTWPADPGLLMSAVITIGGHVAGFSYERVTYELLDRLAKARADTAAKAGS